LNSQSGASGEPVWKTSLTVEYMSILFAKRMEKRCVHTFVEAIHVQLPHKRGNVGMLEV
jgi:hypothetical protein